jgi:phage baseplate assembly protein W
MAQVKKTYDFNSVGMLQSTFQTNKVQTTPNVPIGILTPISFDKVSSSMFLMSDSLAEQVRDNMRNLLNTNHGERLMQTDFGANLKELAYEFTSEDVIGEALFRISKAVSKFMPFVSLDTFEVSTNTEDDIIVNDILVGYSIPSIGAINQKVQISIVVAN